MMAEDIAEGYAALVTRCEALDYSDLEATFEFADRELSQISWELALIVMVNVVMRAPRYFDEYIWDHSCLVVEAVGSSSTYGYLRAKHAECDDHRIRRRLESPCAILKRKYPYLSGVQ